MEKLNFKEKIAVFVGTIILGSILFYAIPANLNYSFSYLFNKENKEKTIELNNKKYLGKIIKGPFKYVRYIFTCPPGSFDNPPIPSYFNDYYSSNLNQEGYDFTLDEYKSYKNDQLESIVNDPTNPEFSAREDTLRMLIEKYNSN